MQWSDLTFLSRSLFQVCTIHTLNKKKNTAPWYRSNTAVALFLRQIFAMRATLFEQLQVYCLHMYKHALFRWFNLIRHFHDITIFYFLFFFCVLFPSFSFLTPMRGKFILLARNSCPCTLQEEVNSILASCFFWIYVVIMKENEMITNDDIFSNHSFYTALLSLLHRLFRASFKFVTGRW